MKEVRGIRNNNPLNIIKGNNWMGERPNQTDPTFEQFVSMEYGIRAALKLIRRTIDGRTLGGRPCNTIRKLIFRWAPPTENNSMAYVDVVCKHTGISPDAIIHSNNRKEVLAIARAMAFVECGQWLDQAYFDSAWSLL